MAQVSTLQDLCRLVITGAASLLVACGGGGGGGAAPPEIEVHLVEGGTYLRCSHPQEIQVQLLRVTAGVSSTSSISCPSSRVLADDYALSKWTLQSIDAMTGVPNSLATTNTALPTPTVVADGDHWVVLPPVQSVRNRIPGLELQAIGVDGEAIATVDDTAAIPMSALANASGTSGISWRWKASSGGTDYVSTLVATLQPVETDLGFWGALAFGDTNGDGIGELLGTTTTTSSTTVRESAAAELEPLAMERTSRDVRLVDLNNDGRNDIVSNVYGSGCAKIGLRRTDGSYDFSEPLCADGTCIGGYGETILVADFDGDGLIDILLPSYERFDYLKNLGGGKFIEIADSLGISYPNYLPHVEGAAAVDLNLDGAIDIVIANEILINDGQGHFTPMSSPFGALRIADEGMSVFDLDGDGFYDIVKHDPSRGPHMFWGEPDRLHFADGGWQFGGDPVMAASFGLSIGYFTGNRLPDVLYAGGSPNGPPPRVCVQAQPRQLNCLQNMLPAHPGVFQDLLMVTDINGDGSSELVSRQGSLRLLTGAAAPAKVFRIDLRDANGHHNQHGRSMRASCSVDGSLLGLRFVDGGNGYMTQSDYIVPFNSHWCPSIWLDVATKSGLQRFGPLQPGTHQLMTNS